MFKVVIALEDGGEHETFPDAFAEFFHKTRELVVKGTTRQILETACWISYTSDGDEDSGEIPLLFYDVAVLAHKVGILTPDGKLVDPVPSVDPLPILEAFTDSGLEMLRKEVEILTTINNLRD